jgi:hypothetical protein
VAPGVLAVDDHAGREDADRVLANDRPVGVHARRVRLKLRRRGPRGGRAAALFPAVAILRVNHCHTCHRRQRGCHAPYPLCSHVLTLRLKNDPGDIA